MSSAGDVTQLLRAWRGGDSAAFDALIPLIYQELHLVASAQMRNESSGHTLSPTALLHESFLKMMQSGSTPDWQDRKHFFVVAARAMRRLLVDHARRKSAVKRTNADAVNGLPASLAVFSNPAVDVVDLDRVLAALHEQAPRRAQMLELRYFGGLGLAEIAEVTECSTATVSRELRVTEAWLARELRGGGGQEESDSQP